jgi:hypothetical protein
MAGKSPEREATGAILGKDGQASLSARGVEVLNEFSPNAMQIRMLQRLEFEILVAGGKYGGKASPINSLVLTPYGFKRMSEISVGTKVCNPDGSVSTVIAVYPQGRKKIVRIRFQDGSEARCTEDHLWLARWNAQKWVGKERAFDDEGWRICITSKMRERIARNQDSPFSYQVPLTDPVEFLNTAEPPIDPYAFGALLGDAHFGEEHVSFTSADPEIIEQLENGLGKKCSSHRTGISYGVSKQTGVLDYLRTVGLAGKLSYEKFIPREYLQQTIENRIALLQGLMDTDGYADSRGHTSFTSTSEQLAKDVQWLVRSLGGRASITPKKGMYKKNGKRIECRTAYTVYIVFVGSKIPLFRFNKKSGRYLSRVKTAHLADVKSIESITDDGVEEAQCITVDNPNGLYITDDFTVTHNSFGAIFWLVKGNVDKPDYDEQGNPILVNMSYVYHPHFLAAVIRLNEKDLAEWVDKARPYYEGVLGGTYTKNPSEFRWKSGARIFCGHAQDSNAWTKYQGQNITRFLIEEAGQIPDIDTYDQIRSCCRSTYQEMRAQILLTANPGGPGQGMLFDRFIEPKDRDGNPILIDGKPITTGLVRIVEKAKNPFTGEDIESDRVWVPSYLSDNPHALANTSYIAALATMSNEKLKRAYLFGDWRAMQGTYFDNFSRETHTYDPRQRYVADWWRATASLDWGFVHESAAYWHKQDPETKQHLIYREFTTTRTDPVELGAELARRSLPELKAQGSLTFHVSHDLYHERIGDFTWIELIAKGVQRVLGDSQCYMPEVVLKQVQERYRMEGRQWDESIEDRIWTKEVSGIVFRRAPKSRAVGFMYMRSLMRMEPLLDTENPLPDMELAQRIVQEGTLENYVAYLNSFKREVEILPQLLISQDCPVLIDAIPKCIHSEENPEDISDKHFRGLDSIDSIRYLLSGIRDATPTVMPKELNRLRQLEEARRRNPTLTTADMITISRSIEQQEAEADAEISSFNRGRASRALRNQRLLT